MKMFFLGGVTVALAVSVVAAERRISVADYRDKMIGGWIGQIAGVCWGAPTEFKFNGSIIPEKSVPVWKPAMINDGFSQDDIYVEMTFLRTLEQYGLDVGIRRAGIDFANSQYKLWCANDAGRKNLRKGIAPPSSSDPAFTLRGNDIDYQIEADYAGLICPGMPRRVLTLGETFGRLMNYGDGLYAGQFIGAMYAEAFFTSDRIRIIEAGLRAIPAESDYAKIVREMVAWYRENPKDWESAWKKFYDKYANGKCKALRDSNGGIDVRINGAMVLLGYLFGEGDIDKTIVISMRGGYDSDCNPSSSGGILCTSIGMKQIPARFSESFKRNVKFSYTDYTFDELVVVCEKLARQIVLREGGRMEKTADGVEWFVIPENIPVPGPYVPTWKAPKMEISRFTKEESKQLKFPDTTHHGLLFVDPDPTVRVQKVLDKVFPGWKTSPNATDMNPGFLDQYGAEHGKNLLLTHPPRKGEPVTLSRRQRIPDGDPKLFITVSNAERGNFDLIVRINGQELFRSPVSGPSSFRKYVLGLHAYAGKEVTLEVLNMPTDWAYEAAIWEQLEVTGNN